MSENGPQMFMTEAPTDPIDVPWAEEVLDATDDAREDPQLRLMLGGRPVELLDRLERAPRRNRYFMRVRSDQIDPVEVPDADEGWYRDVRTGRWAVLEDDGWRLETPFPAGAFTLGELAELDRSLSAAAEAMAQAAEAGILTPEQRKAAFGVVNAAENVELRLALHAWQPSPEEREAIKASALEMIAASEPEPESPGPAPPKLRVVKNRRRQSLKQKLMR